MSENYKAIAERKQAQRLSLIPTEWLLKSPPSSSTLNVQDVPRNCGILSALELEITEQYDATALAEAISSRRLKCVDVTRAYCKVSTYQIPTRQPLTKFVPNREQLSLNS